MSSSLPGTDIASVFGVPAEVGAAVNEFRSCELSTIARDGTPVTWPTAPFFEPEQRRFFVTSAVALAQKTFNIQRDPRVAMLFSNPTGSGLVSPPVVLIQGDAEVSPALAQPDDERFDWMSRLIFERQPVGVTMLGAVRGPVRSLADWYCWRILVYIHPRRIRWWPDGDYGRPCGEVML